MNLLKNRKFNLVHLLLLSTVASLVTFGFTSAWETQHDNAQIAGVSHVCKVDVKRLNGLKYIRPIMFDDDECESDDLAGLKQKVSQIINRYKANGEVASASFYLRRFDNSDWTSLNDEEVYQPASLLKVPVLITILKMNEDAPGFLDKVIAYNRPFIIEKDIAYQSKSIELGKSYTVRELLKYMIKYSDNNATGLLEANMRMDVFEKVFEDLGLKTPRATDKQYLMSAKEYSLFMCAIYNAAYLTIKDSEFAAELLTECDFKEGILKGLPNKIAVAHKFGEAGDTNEKQLHESAIIYLNEGSYLLTVMTRGKEQKNLSKLIAEISEAIYFEMQGNSLSVM